MTLNERIELARNASSNPEYQKLLDEAYSVAITPYAISIQGTFDNNTSRGIKQMVEELDWEPMYVDDLGYVEAVGPASKENTSYKIKIILT